MARPDWKSAKSYPSVVDGMDYRAWAWEFLRRNEDYQKECENALERKSIPFSMSIANRYGLVHLIDYKANIDFSDRERRWLSETICKSKMGKMSRFDNSIPQLKSGEFALVFDLNLTIEAGPAAIESMLYVARQDLLSARDEYIKSADLSVRSLRPKTPKIRKSKLFTWLRVYDAIIYSGAPRLEVAKELYPEFFILDSCNGETQEIKACKQIAADLTRAKSMVKDEYLVLPPLDYLQKRSKVRGRK